MVATWFTVLTLAATALGASIAPSSDLEVEQRSACGRIWITVHSPEIRISVTNRLLDALELNWDFVGCSTATRRIGLFNNRPGAWNQARVSFTINTVQGHVVTSIPLGAGTLPAGWQNGPGTRGTHCLWPWVGAGTAQQVQIANCLKIQPNWMQDQGPRINHLRIGQLVIPGTHNAGAWRFNNGGNTAERDSFVLCQDRSIWQQLVYGIRYFDFRIAYYNSFANVNDRYWLNHNMIRVRPLVPLLREIRLFLDVTREVVFLDAHQFPVGFYAQNGAPIRDVHMGLLTIIQRELGPHIAPFWQFGTAQAARGPTLQTLVNANRRLLFSYIDNSIVSQNNWLWPRIPHLWANTNNPNQLFQFLDQGIATSPRPNERSPIFAAMVQTTPTALDIALQRGSIRQNADVVNRQVTRRLTYNWQNRASIIASDFFLGNDVVDVSISINVMRGRSLSPF